MTTMQQLEAAQESPEVVVNENFETLEHQAVYGKDPTTTTGLTWGYVGGRWGGFSVSAGTVSLNASNTVYMVAAMASGAVSIATASTNWDNATDYRRIYKFTTSGSAVTAVEDHRAGPGGVHGSSGAGTFQPLDADLTTIAGLTATTDNFIQAKSSAWASRTPAQVTTDLQGTGLDVDAAGFRGIPQNAQTGNYTTVAADAGKHIFHASGAGAGDTYTIDSNANVAYELGTAITFVNLDSNAVSIAITSDTLTWAAGGGSGTRQLAQYGIATAVKVSTTQWLISGSNLS
jgi:hypothetical protein